MRVASRIARQIKTYDFKKLGNIWKMSKWMEAEHSIQSAI